MPKFDRKAVDTCSDHLYIQNTRNGRCDRLRIRVDLLIGKSVDCFCNIHACYKCVEVELLPSAEATDSPPSNTCRVHPLCWVKNCSQLQLQGSEYCQTHSIIPCRFRSSARNQLLMCGAPSISPDVPYCSAHFDLWIEAPEKRRMIQSLPAEESDSSDSSSSYDKSERATNFASNSKPQQRTGINKRRKQCGATACIARFQVLSCACASQNNAREYT